jgi:hypothetical protein
VAGRCRQEQVDDAIARLTSPSLRWRQIMLRAVRHAAKLQPRDGCLDAPAKQQPRGVWTPEHDLHPPADGEVWTSRSTRRRRRTRGQHSAPAVWTAPSGHGTRRRRPGARAVGSSARSIRVDRSTGGDWRRRPALPLSLRLWRPGWTRGGAGMRPVAIDRRWLVCPVPILRRTGPKDLSRKTGGPQLSASHNGIFFPIFS